NPPPKTTRRSSSSDDDDDQESTALSVLDILRVLSGAVVLFFALSYFITNGESFFFNRKPKVFTKAGFMALVSPTKVFTESQLKQYDGSDPAKPIYLAINGTVFDVSANRATYGPGGGYGFFAGRDATRAYVTGCFKEDLTPDLRGVEQMFIPVEDNDDDPEEQGMTAGEKKARREEEWREAHAQVQKQVDHWEGFFRNHATYFEVGKVVGGPGVKGEGVER